MNIPEDCYKDYGTDLDSCSTQESEGCGRCSYMKNYNRDSLLEMNLVYRNGNKTLFRYFLPTSAGIVKIGIAIGEEGTVVENIKKKYEREKAKYTGIEFYYDKIKIELHQPTAHTADVLEIGEVLKENIEL